MGGGLGHLTRACAVLHSLHTHGPAVILSSSLFVANFHVPGGICLRVVPGFFAQETEAYWSWLTQLLAELQPQALFLDTFPAGIVGEFCDFPALEQVAVYYVARRLKWSVYERQLGGCAPTFQRTFCLEPLEEAHAQFVRTQSLVVDSLLPVDPPRQLSVLEQETLEKVLGLAHPFWLVVHSGSHDEMVELIAYAEEMRRYEGSSAQLVIAGAARDVAPTPHLRHLGLFPAQVLFPFAERIISACGFNMMRQMTPFRHKHYYLPFARRFDDQYWRAAYWRTNSSATSGAELRGPCRELF